jgi:hypothetical protein
VTNSFSDYHQFNASPGTGDDQGLVRVDDTEDRSQHYYTNLTELGPTSGGRDGDGDGGLYYDVLKMLEPL